MSALQSTVVALSDHQIYKLFAVFDMDLVEGKRGAQYLLMAEADLNRDIPTGNYWLE